MVFKLSKEHLSELFKRILPIPDRELPALIIPPLITLTIPPAADKKYPSFFDKRIVSKSFAIKEITLWQQ